MQFITCVASNGAFLLVLLLRRQNCLPANQQKITFKHQIFNTYSINFLLNCIQLSLNLRVNNNKEDKSFQLPHYSLPLDLNPITIR